jgi:PAS domain S-box-containing protein
MEPADALSAAESFALLFETNPQPGCIFDQRTLGVLEANQEAVRHYGYKREEFLALTVDELWSSEARAALRHDILSEAAAGAAGMHSIGTRRLLRKDRSHVDVEIAWGRCRFKGRDAMLMLLHDITERILAEGTLWEREAHLRTIVTGAPLIVWAVDRQGVFTLSEGKGLQQLGLRLGEVVGRSAFQFYRDHPDIPGQIRRALSGETFTATVAVAALRFEAHFAPLRGPDGEIVGATGVALDVTQRLRAEDALAAQRDFLRRVLDINPSFVFAKDHEGRFTLANRAVAEAYGTTIEGLIGKTDADFNANPAEVEWFRRDDLEVMSTGREKFIPEEMITDARGQRRWLQTVKRPLLGQDGRAEQVLGVATDITERRRAEALRSALYRIAEQADEAKEMTELYERIHVIVAELMPARNFYIAVREDEAGLLRFPYFVDEMEPNPGARPLGRGLTEHVLRTGETLLVTPERWETLCASGEVALVGAPSLDWLGAPLKSGGKTFGVVAVQSYAQTQRYGERDREVLDFVSWHIAGALERKRNREALEESLHFTQEIILSAAEGVLALDRELRCRLWNPALERITGVAAQRALGRPVAEALPGLAEAGFPALFERVLAGEIVRATDIALRIPSLKTLRVSARLSPHRDARGEIAGLVALVAEAGNGTEP